MVGIWSQRMASCSVKELSLKEFGFEEFRYRRIHWEWVSGEVNEFVQCGTTGSAAKA